MTKLTRASTFRKMAMGSWRTVGDPSVYALVEIDMSAANRYIASIQKEHGVKITPTHLVGRAAAQILKIRPEINGMIRGCRIYLRKHVTLFFQVNIPGSSGDKVGKADLSGCSVPEAENRTLLELAAYINKQASRVKARENKELKKSTNITKLIPWCMIGPFLRFTSWLIYGLNLNLSWFGFPKDPFGSIMITNVGSLGIDVAWAPLLPFSRVPMLLTLGTIQDRVVVIDGKMEIRPILSVACTFDHRFIDGVQGAHMAKLIKSYFLEPERYLN